MAQSQWVALRVGREDLPPLLVKATFGEDGYEVHLTDLSRIWGEVLSKEALIKRANDRRCPIDPGEDEEQYGILLDKLKRSLHGDEQASLDLDAQGDQGEQIILDISVTLPRPLPPLKWALHLDLLPQHQVATEVVLPLLLHADSLRAQMQRLVKEIAAKDKIITKVTDRLETSGHDLTAVFPGASGVKLTRRKSQREQLGSHVRGLETFDEEAWRRQRLSPQRDLVFSADLLNKIFEPVPGSLTSTHTMMFSSDWWQQLSENGSSNHPTARLLLSSAGGEDSIEDAFQTQVTPPRLKHRDSARPHSPTPAGSQQAPEVETQREAEVEHDSSTDDDDLDAPSQKPLRNSQSLNITASNAEEDDPDVSSQRPPKDSQKTNSFPSGNEAQSPEPEAPASSRTRQSTKTHEVHAGLTSPVSSNNQTPRKPVSNSQTPRKLGVFGGRRSQAQSQVPPPPLFSTQTSRAIRTPTPEPATPKPKAKLGRTGGRSQSTATQQLSEPPSSPSLPSPARARRLGAFGGQRPRTENTSQASQAAASTAAPSQKLPPVTEERDAPPSRASRAPEKQSSPAARETSEERANQKRDQLKRELEAKAKAPAKKRRKF